MQELLKLVLPNLMFAWMALGALPASANETTLEGSTEGVTTPSPATNSPPGGADGSSEALHDARGLKPISLIHGQLLAKFTPVDQPHGDVAINHSGDEVFTGDCDDYYAAAFNQLYAHGYDPFALILAVRQTGKPHLVACVEQRRHTLCLDHNANRPSSLRTLRRRYDVIEKRSVVRN